MSRDDTELEPRIWPPRCEKVGVRGVMRSEDELLSAKYTEVSPNPRFSTTSAFLRSSTSCGNNKGLSFGDILSRLCGCCWRAPGKASMRFVEVEGEVDNLPVWW